MNNSEAPEPWHLISRTLAYDASPWLRHYIDKVRLTDGRVVDDFHVVETREHSVVFALTDEDLVVTERQYRHGVQEVCTSLPAGYIEFAETPEEAARRELLEETGYAAREWRHLGSFVMSGNRGMGALHVFLAKGTYLFGTEQKLDALEKISVRLVPLHSVRDMLDRGDFKVVSEAMAAALALLTLQDEM